MRKLITPNPNCLKYFCCAFVLTAFSACAPLHFDMYTRNMTNDTTYLTLVYKTDKPDNNKNIEVRYTPAVLDINSETLGKLRDSLHVASVGDNQKLLVIPPHATVHLSDLIYSIYEFADKTLIFKNANGTDSIRFNYPYRRIKGVKHKRRNAFSFFYRTILYYDIKNK